MKYPVSLGTVALALSAVFILGCGSTDAKRPPPITGGSGGDSSGGSGGIGGSGAGGGGAGGRAAVDAAPVDNKIELKIAWWGGTARADRTNAVARLFEKDNPNISIKTEFQMITQGTGTMPGVEYWPTMNKYAADGTLPDIMQQDYAYIEDWNARKLLRPLDDYLADGSLKLADVPKGLIDGGKVDGKVVAISLGTNTQAIVIDLDLFAKHNIAIPKDDWTWDDFEAIAKEIKTKENIFGFGSGLWGYTPGWKAVYLSLGQWVFSNDGKSLGYTDDKPWADHFNMILRLKRLAALPTLAEEPMGTNVEGLLMVTKKSGMEHVFSNQLVGLWNAANAMNGGVQRNLKMLPLPKVKGGKSPIYMKPSQYWSITSTSKHPKEAAKFIEFFTNDIEANKVLAGERGVPVNSKVLAELKKSLDKIAGESFDLIERGGAYATALPPNDPPPWTTILNTVLNPLSKEVMEEHITAEQGVALFRTQASALLAGQPIPDGGPPDVAGPGDGGAPDGGGGGFEIPPGLRALLVTGPTPDAVDMEVRARLERKVVVDLLPEATATTGDATGKALVVITASASLAGTGTKFRDVPVPVIVLEPNLFPPMRMTGEGGANQGTATQTQLAIIAPESPLAASLTGTVAVYMNAYRMVFGVPAASATRVATVVGNANQSVIFAYPSGAEMVGGTAAAKRVGFFIHNSTTPNNVLEPGFQLLDAAVDWSLTP